MNLQDPAVVRQVLAAGAGANREAACRQGSIDGIRPPGTLIATGDLHDNPLHFARLVRAAGMDCGSDEVTKGRSDEVGEEVARTSGSAHSVSPSLGLSVSTPSHLVLHELIHSDRLINGMDFSYRALARAAALKAEFPERVHVLLANHELAQIMGAGIVKDGVKVVEAFD